MQSYPNNATVHEEWVMCDAFRMVDQLLSLNSRTCFGSLLFSPVLSLTGTKTHIEGLVWPTAELMSKESPFEIMHNPGKHLWRPLRFMPKVMKIGKS